MSGPLPPSLLSDIAARARKGRAGSIVGAQVKMERATSSGDKLAAVLEKLSGPVQFRSSVINDSWSFDLPTVAFISSPWTVGLWHCNEGTGDSAADSSDNDNDLTLSNVSWDTGKFSDGLSFNGSSSVASATLTTTEPVRRYLYFAAWINPTSGPLFQWEDVLEVYISGGNLVAQVEDQTYTGPALGSGWQLAHVQFFDGMVLIGVDDVVWAFTHTDNTLTISAWAVTFGKRDSTYYSGLMDEMRLVSDVVLQEDWGKRLYRAQESSVMYCPFDAGSGTTERHQDFFGSAMTLSGLSWQTGYIDSAVRFDGASGFATFTPLLAATPTKISIEMVLRFSVVAACTLIDQTSGLNLSFTGTAIRAALQGVTSPNTDIATWTPTVDTWYTLTLVYDGAEKQVWINGQKRGVLAATGTGSIPASAVYLGRTVAGADYFTGDLDFIHIAKSPLRPQNRPIHRFVIGQDGMLRTDDWVLMDD